MSIKKEITVFVEGNIGCGKSSFLQFFRKLSSNIEIAPEPLHMWKNVRGHDLFVLATDLHRQLKTQVLPVRLLERSPYSRRYCFLELMHRNGDITIPDYKELDRIFKNFVSEKAPPVDLIVYLRTDPLVCMKRVKKRCRTGENSIPLEYLEKLHNCHEAWLMKEAFGQPPAPVLVFNCNAPFHDLISDYRARQFDVMCGVPLS